MWLCFVQGSGQGRARQASEMAQGVGTIRGYRGIGDVNQ
jgi:hypothetical protein